MKAIIIGAGIGGLTTAIALEKQRITVEVYEKSPEIKVAGAGLSLWKNALMVLDTLGVGESLREGAVSGHDGALRSALGEILASMQQYDDSGVMTAVVHRSELHHLLADAMQSPIYTGKVFTHYENTETGVIAHFEDGTIVEADVLIAGDGIHSPVRKQMLPDSEPIYSGYTAFRGVVSFDHARLKGVWGESWGNGLRFGITMLSDNRVYWFCTDNVPANVRYDAIARKQYIQRLYSGWHEPIADLIAETAEDAILHHDIYDIAPLSTWQDGHVILLGDAAHAMTPNLGQGACQAIEDAYALAYCLAGNENIHMGLAQYQALRMPRTKQIMQQSRQIGKVGQLDNPLICWMRNRVVKLVPENIRNQSLHQVAAYDIKDEMSKL